MFIPWFKLAGDTAMLALEAQTVIGLRLGQMAMGRGSLAESQLMVTEKVQALMEAGATMATGGSAHKVVKDYRRKVRANSTMGVTSRSAAAAAGARLHLNSNRVSSQEPPP